ncbi:MAG: ImmA/IrrE family metallo-endopeptidase [Dehalococcoidia bacterium]|nr:ImmA/IrrE family metallo-endopeptidase [Dehalococcoidia bacterium]
MNYRRGFKKEANEIVNEVRRELRISLVAQLDAHVLADYLGIEVVPLREFRGIAEEGVFYFHRHTELFSALTVFDGTRRLIVHNERHSAGRTNANIAHELAHALLFHEPTPALDSEGSRSWNPDIESEAVWLGAALLVPEAASLQVVRRGVSIEAAATYYGVSESVMALRLNVTGARRRIARANRR